MNRVPNPLEANGPRAIAVDDALKVLCRDPILTESKFTAFRYYYDEVRLGVHPGRLNGDTIIPIERSYPLTHGSVIQAVEKPRSRSEKTAETFWTEAFPSDDNPIDAARRTVKLTYLIDPASQNSYPIGFRFENESVFPVKWESNQTFREFFNTAFPTTDPKVLEVWKASSRRTSLKAWKLHKRLKLEIVPTNDLAERLVYNPHTKSSAVFHQVEWLKAQVGYVENRELHEPVELSLAAGTLPPQLLFETLYTIYAILFPVGTDKRSLKFVKRLVQGKGPATSVFDRNLLIYGRSAYQPSTDFEYLYWNRRLKALQALVETRPPRNSIVS